MVILIYAPVEDILNATTQGNKLLLQLSSFLLEKVIFLALSDSLILCCSNLDDLYVIGKC